MALIDPTSIFAPPEPRALNPDRAAAARALAVALDGWEADGRRWSARVEARPAPGCWITGPVAAIRVDRLGDAAVPLHPERPAEIAAALDRLDPVLSALEARIGLALEFDATALAPPTDTVAVQVAWLGDDPGALALAPLTAFPLAADSPPSLDARLPVRLRCAGLRLGVEEAASMAPGDLLLLPPQPWPARLEPLGRAELDGSWGPDGWRMGATMGEHENGGGGGPGGGLTVPTTIAFPATDVALSELEALVPGATLPLGPVTAGLEVEVRVSGRTVATGELVRLGDQYAVLITDAATAGMNGRD